MQSQQICATIPNGLFFSVPSHRDYYCVICLFGKCLAIPQQRFKTKGQKWEKNTVTKHNKCWPFFTVTEHFDLCWGAWADMVDDSKLICVELELTWLITVSWLPVLCLPFLLVMDRIEALCSLSWFVLRSLNWHGWLQWVGFQCCVCLSCLWWIGLKHCVHWPRDFQWLQFSPFLGLSRDHRECFFVVDVVGYLFLFSGS